MKYLFAIMAVLLLSLSIALPGTAGPGRPSFSSRSSYSGSFRSSSSSSYRSFSSPSRSFSFRSSPSTSTVSRPAAAPRSYSYSTSAATVARPVSRSTVKRTVINNHYHGDAGHGSGGGSGLSLMDVVAINALTNHNNSPTYFNTQPVVAGPAYSQPIVANDGYQDGPAVIYQREESHFWRNLIVFLIGLGCLYGVYRLFRYLAVEV